MCQYKVLGHMPVPPTAAALAVAWVITVNAPTTGGHSYRSTRATEFKVFDRSKDKMDEFVWDV